jgi:hypothetical protein
MARRGARSSNAFDQALKLLSTQWAADLAQIFYPGTRLDEPLPGDLPVAERRADALWRAHLAGEACVLHMEYQLRAKPDLAERMFGYASRIAGYIDDVRHTAVSKGRYLDVAAEKHDVLRAVG